MQYVTLEEMLRLHFQVIEDFGGAHGVRDEHQLASLAAAPQQDAFGVEQYPTVYEKAAVYLRNLIGDHVFVDGNKRTAVVVCAIFLTRNGIRLKALPVELEDFVVQVATEHLDVAAIAVWLRA